MIRGTGPIRVLIVEDSAFMRLQLRSFIEGDRRFLIVGEAHDGEEALKLVRELSPDVITLDLELPKKDGIEVLQHVMKERPTPVLIVSVLARENAEITLKALELGAVDYITKPNPTQVPLLREEFPLKLFHASRAKLHRLKIFSGAPPSPARGPFIARDSGVVVIGASIGGPQTLHFLLPQLPPDFPAPVIVVQHMPKVYSGKFTLALRDRCGITVKEAAEGERLKPGTVYVAPGGSHLALTVDKRIVLNDDPPVNSVKPSVDVTLAGVARLYKERAIAVILTGMGRDGTQGAAEVKRYGGTVVAESEESCVVYGMSRSVIEAGLCDFPLPLEKIGPFLLEKFQCRTA